MIVIVMHVVTHVVSKRIASRSHVLPSLSGSQAEEPPLQDIRSETSPGAYRNQKQALSVMKKQLADCKVDQGWQRKPIGEGCDRWLQSTNYIGETDHAHQDLHARSLQGKTRGFERLSMV